MISVIICSRTSEINPIFYKNIINTIGCQHELIVIDNSQNEYSIFEAYNFGIVKSHGDYWCFIHDDILFHNQDWGKVVERIFAKDPKIGLIGVAGAKIKTKMPSAWWDCPDDLKVLNIIQHLNSGKIEKWEIGWNNDNLEEVVVIDGVFMVARRIRDVKFSDFLKGFHNYDLNLSFEYIKRNYKIFVTREIILEHFSLGTIDSSWYKSTLKIHELYSKILPLKIDYLSDFDLNKIEFNNVSRFLMGLIECSNKVTVAKLWFKLFILKPKSKFHFKFLKQFLK